MSELGSSTLKDAFYVSVGWCLLDALATNFNVKNGMTQIRRFGDARVIEYRSPLVIMSRTLRVGYLLKRLYHDYKQFASDYQNWLSLIATVDPIYIWIDLSQTQ